MATELWYELLDELVGQKGLSRPQIEQRSGVPAKTLTSWLRGDVIHPRHWQPVAAVLGAIGATEADAETILRLAGGWHIADLTAGSDAADKELLRPWLQPAVTNQAPDRLAPAVIGRDESIEAAINILKLHRRCALVGMAGVGKTTLAVELAHRRRMHYRDGVFWGDLALSSLEAILESWGQACGVDMSRLGDLHSRAARMRGIFAQKQALIVLDDVVDEEAAALLLPARHSESAMLCTTRSHDVARALTSYQPAQIVQIEPLTRDSSLRMLADVIGEGGGLRDMEHAGQVAELLGDLPLALRIAAALCLPTDPAGAAEEGLTLAQLAVLLQQLQTRLATLRVGRKATVRLAFEQSWELLGPALQAAYSTLAVFEGRAFSLDAFAFVAGLDAPRASWALARLSLLSLLQTRSAGKRRYQQHALLAAFAAEKLGDGDPAWENFITYYHSLAWESSRRGESLAGDRENVMAAMRAAHRRRDWIRVLGFRDALESEWQSNGLYAMARQAYALAFDAAEAQQEPQTLAELELLQGLAGIEQSDYEPARRHLSGALARYEALADPRHIGDARLGLARVELEEEGYGRAEEELRSAWLSYQQAEDLRGMGLALYRLGRIRYLTSDYDNALRLVEDAIDTLTTAGDPPGLSRSHMLAAQAHIHRDALEEAQQHLEAAARHSELTDDAGAKTDLIYTSAEVSRWQKRFAESNRFALEALEFYDKVCDSKSQVHARMLLANLEVEWNDAEPQRRAYEAGFRFVNDGIRLCELIGYDLGHAHLLLTRGKLYRQQLRMDEAHAAWHEALAVNHSIQNSWLDNRLRALLAGAP